MIDMLKKIVMGHLCYLYMLACVSIFSATTANASIEAEKEAARAQLVQALSGQQAVIVASRKTTDEAIQFSQELQSTLQANGADLDVNVFLANNGWYAISIGVVPTPKCGGIVSELLKSGVFPNDTFCSEPSKYTALFSLDGSKLVPVVGRDFNRESDNDIIANSDLSSEEASNSNDKSWGDGEAAFVVYGTSTRFQAMQLSGNKQKVAMIDPQRGFTYCTAYLGQTEEADATLEGELRIINTAIELQDFLKANNIAEGGMMPRTEQRRGCQRESYAINAALMANSECQKANGAIFASGRCISKDEWNSLNSSDQQYFQNDAEIYAQSLSWTPDSYQDGEILIVQKGIPFNLKDYIVLGELDPTKLDKSLANYDTQQNSFRAEYTSITTGDERKFGAINLGWLVQTSGYQLCSIISTPRDEWSSSAYFKGLNSSTLSNFLAQKYRSEQDSPDFNENSPLVFASGDEFLISYQSQREAVQCGMLIADTLSIKAVSETLASLNFRFDFNRPTLVKELEEAFAKSNGYVDLNQLDFALEINASQEEVKQLQGYGLTDSAQLTTLFTEMKSASYSNISTIGEALSYLSDKKSASALGISVIEARNARESREAAERERLAIKQRQEQEVDIKRYPYLATISCKFGNNPVVLEACMYDTELEVMSDGRSQLYQAYNLSSAGQMTQNGLEIKLTEKFSIRAQNGEKNLTLEVSVEDRTTLQQVFQDVAGSYRSIFVRN